MIRDSRKGNKFSVHGEDEYLLNVVYALIVLK